MIVSIILNSIGFQSNLLAVILNSRSPNYKKVKAKTKIDSFLASRYKTNTLHEPNSIEQVKYPRESYLIIA